MTISFIPRSIHSRDILVHTSDSTVTYCLAHIMKQLQQACPHISPPRLLIPQPLGWRQFPPSFVRTLMTFATQEIFRPGMDVADMQVVPKLMAAEGAVLTEIEASPALMAGEAVVLIEIQAALARMAAKASVVAKIHPPSFHRPTIEAAVLAVKRHETPFAFVTLLTKEEQACMESLSQKKILQCVKYHIRSLNGLTPALEARAKPENAVVMKVLDSLIKAGFDPATFKTTTLDTQPRQKGKPIRVTWAIRGETTTFLSPAPKSRGPSHMVHSGNRYDLCIFHDLTLHATPKDHHLYRVLFTAVQPQ